LISEALLDFQLDNVSIRAYAVAMSNPYSIEHTPGPWRIIDEAPYLVFGSLHGVAIATVDPSRQGPIRGYLTDRINMTDEEYAESETDEWHERRQAEMLANARLIAAAPDLLWALREVLDSLGALGNHSDLCGRGITDADQERIWRTLAAVEGRK
jgi:hypothetical protein